MILSVLFQVYLTLFFLPVDLSSLSSECIHFYLLFLLYFAQKLHGPSILAVKAKFYGVLYKQSSSIAFDETSSYWSALKSS